MSLCPHGYTAFWDCPTCPEPMGTFSLDGCKVCGAINCTKPHTPVDRTPKLSDFHTPEFRALFRYRRLAEKAEAAGSRLTAQEAWRRYDAIRDYVESKIG